MLGKEAEIEKPRSTDIPNKTRKSGVRKRVVSKRVRDVDCDVPEIVAMSGSLPGAPFLDLEGQRRTTPQKGFVLHLNLNIPRERG